MRLSEISLARFSPALLWLYAGNVLAVGTHIPRIPVWISLLFLLICSARLFYSNPDGQLRQHSAPLMKLLAVTLAAVILAGVWLSYGTLMGREAGISLLILLTGMKFLEMKTPRDYHIAGFLGLFLILTGFLYSQTIPVAVYMLLSVGVLVSALIACNDPGRGLATVARLRLAGTLLAQSLPLVVLIFLLFPRIPGPLWGMPRDANSGLSGLGEEMSPGAITRLIESDDIAFRVKFEGGTPRKSALYWRGPVLWTTDGVTWVRSRLRRAAPPRVTLDGPGIAYTITQEPGPSSALFALELPEAPAEQAFFTHDYQIRSQQPLDQRKQYSLISHTRYRLESGAEEELGLALQLPYDYHPRAVALGRSWREAGLPPREIVRSAMRQFNEEPFYYTLTPPAARSDLVDEFLFETRQGFCEHYAAAFVVLMRAAGIPARVVTGYQGGTLNPLDGYLVVRQRDAHAWAEVWLEEGGWTRVDPTSAVSPARVNEGIEGALPDSILDMPAGFAGSGFLGDVWRRLRNTFEAIDNRWNQWVLSYDRNRQARVLRGLGLGTLEWEGLLLTLGVLTGLILTILGILMFRARPRQGDRARLLYDRFCRRLERIGIPRRSHEGPDDFARRVGTLRRDLARPIEEITKLYIETRYAGRQERLVDLENILRGFRPRKRTA
jgi:transglutaminase-like putative cysteine protease